MCDRCGAFQLPQVNYKVITNTKPGLMRVPVYKPGEVFEGDHNRVDKDLCITCHKELMQFLSPIKK
jgi:hypothetical protein